MRMTRAELEESEEEELFAAVLAGDAAQIELVFDWVFDTAKQEEQQRQQYTQQPPQPAEPLGWSSGPRARQVQVAWALPNSALNSKAPPPILPRARWGRPPQPGPSQQRSARLDLQYRGPQAGNCPPARGPNLLRGSCGASAQILQRSLPSLSHGSSRLPMSCSSLVPGRFR